MQINVFGVAALSTGNSYRRLGWTLWVQSFLQSKVLRTQLANSSKYCKLFNDQQVVRSKETRIFINTTVKNLKYGKYTKSEVPIVMSED